MDKEKKRLLSFLGHLARFYRRERLVIITDNISTRTGEEAAAWLRSHPRVRFVFTPKHGSWSTKSRSGSASSLAARCGTPLSTASKLSSEQSLPLRNIGTT